MKSQQPAKTPPKNDDHLSWTRPVLKKGGIASETLAKLSPGGDGNSSHIGNAPGQAS
jgi:hypothetical protein